MPKADAKTEHLRRCCEAAGGTWRDVGRLSEPDLARLVRADGCDILVDLTGHTANNRLGAFAMRPAPVQATSDCPSHAAGRTFLGVRPHSLQPNRGPISAAVGH